MNRDHYIHGTTKQEQERLFCMNELLNERESVELRLGGGERILEMGAGTGIFARALAAAVDRGSVVGIERDESQLAAARAAAGSAANLELRAGDVLAPPLADSEWGSFDLVHARFVLEHLTRPEDAVRAMARAVRPGGRVVLVDDDHATLRLFPEAPEFMTAWFAYCELYSRRGMDPWIGRRLARLASDAGLAPVRATMIFFGACRGMASFDSVRDNFRGVVAGAKDDLVESGIAGASTIDAGLAAFDSWAATPASALWYAVPYLEAAREERSGGSGEAEAGDAAAEEGRVAASRS